MTDDYRAAMSEIYDRITQPESDGPARDESGRFTREEEPQDIAVEETPAEETPVQGTDEAPVEAETPIDPPSSWTAEEKARFAALPPETQKYLVQRESERESFLTQKSQEAAKLKQQYEPLEPILSARRSVWASEGMTEAQAIGQLLQLSDYASSDPKGFIEWFAQQRGISLGQPQAEQDPLAPQLAPIVQQIQSIQQRLEATTTQENLALVESFKAEHPHFSDVEQDMLALIPAIRQMNPSLPKHELMKQAYEKAIWSNPTVRDRILAEQAQAKEAERKAQEAKRQEEAKQAAAKARKAGSTQVSTRSPIGSAAPTATSMRDTMERAYARIQSA